MPEFVASPWLKTMVVLSGASMRAPAALTTPASSVLANGLMATLMIDTRGFYGPASFALNLSGTEIGADSAFILLGGGALPATIINGSIQVVAGGYWTGGTGTQWQTPGNWSSAMTPGPTFTAVFDGPPTANQPVLNQAEGVKGIVLKTAGWIIAADGNRNLAVGLKGLSSAGSGTNTIAPTVTFAAPAAIDVGVGNTLVLASVTAGDNALEKSGQGTLVFSGNNLYGGGTTVSEGTLLVSNASGSGTGTGVVSVGAATLGGTGFLPLPAGRLPCFREAQRTVHRDGHVEVAKAYYSVPPEYLGRQVWVRWDGRLVRIFNHRMEPIAVHAQREAGRFSTQSGHIDSRKISSVERGTTWLLRKARQIGPQADRWAQAMLQARGIEGVRVLVGLLALARRQPSDRIEEACGVALTHGAFRLRTIRSLLDRGGGRQEQMAFIEEHPIIRGLADYGEFVRAALHREPAPVPQTPE